MKYYEHLEVNIHDNGIVRIYGNGGMVFEACGNNVRSTTTIYPKPAMPSGEAVRKTDTKK